MARSRSIPTHLFWDQSFSLLCGETQSILIGLTLIADDEGRGLAHTRFLERQLEKNTSQIEQALQELSEAGFLQCYQVGTSCYYQHLHWREWETLSKPTPSRYPAPPVPPHDNSGNPRETPSEEEVKKKQNQEPEEEVKRKQKQEAEAEERVKRPIVVSFPTPTRADDPALSQQVIAEKTAHVAQLLQIEVTQALTRLVEDALQENALSLVGEADAAREWIENPNRNRTGQPMTLAFFRRWLKRERETILDREAQRVQATGTTGMAGSRRTIPSGAHLAPAPNPYQEYADRQERARKQKAEGARR